MRDGPPGSNIKLYAGKNFLPRLYGEESFANKIPIASVPYDTPFRFTRRTRAAK